MCCATQAGLPPHADACPTCRTCTACLSCSSMHSSSDPASLEHAAASSDCMCSLEDRQQSRQRGSSAARSDARWGGATQASRAAVLPIHRPLLQALHPLPLPSSFLPPPLRQTVPPSARLGLQASPPGRRSARTRSVAHPAAVRGRMGGWQQERSLTAVPMSKLALWGAGRAMLLCPPWYRC